MIDLKILKILDTHDILYKKKYLTLKARYGKKIPFFKKRELKNFKKLENMFIRIADVIITNSRLDLEKIKEISPKATSNLISNGQDITYFSQYKANPEKGTILFYGSMGGDQNIKAFFRFWNRILPGIKTKFPDVKVLVVGANPPDSIKKLNNKTEIIVTGFVEDVREFLSKSYLMIIPMEIAAGFRGRVVEVMSMGIPVIGTHNALDCIEMTHGKHGFVSDSDQEMARYAIELLQAPKLRERMSKDCTRFVSEKYSIEASYGKLSLYYSEMA
jgi:glycosyltransferase involved in cell wall biosynthesis